MMATPLYVANASAGHEQPWNGNELVKSFEAQLWREISLHLELGESVRRIAPLMRAVLPIDLVLLRRIEREPLRLTTVAVGVCDARGESELRLSRTECDPSDTAAVER